MVYASGVSDRVIELCNAQETIASSLAKQPDRAAHRVWQQLYPKPFVLKRLVNRFLIKHDLYYGRGDPTEHDLDRAARCGKFPYRPSDLFLKVGTTSLFHSRACAYRVSLGEWCSLAIFAWTVEAPLALPVVIGVLRTLSSQHTPRTRTSMGSDNDPIHRGAMHLLTCPSSCPCARRSSRTCCCASSETRWPACAPHPSLARPG